MQYPLDHHHIIQYFGNPETTMIPGERCIVPASGTPANQQIAPGMMVPFNAALYHEDNGYVFSRQGKPPPDVTGKGTTFAQYILNASNKAGDNPRPLHSKKKTAASR